MALHVATATDEDSDARALLMSATDGGGGMAGRESGVVEMDCMDMSLGVKERILLLLVEFPHTTSHTPITHPTPLKTATVVLKCDALPLAIIIA